MNEASNVAQTGSLLFRRLAAGKPSSISPPADFQSATQQAASLRYSNE
jgi:hypothetical protein